MERTVRRLKRVVIKEELVDLTGNFIESLILNQFIYWTFRTYDFDKFLGEEEKRRGESLEDLKTKGWIHKKASCLREELMLDVTDVTIRKYISSLVEKGWIEERGNPEIKWDKTLQYRVNFWEVHTALISRGYPGLEGVTFSVTPQKTEQRNLASDQRNPGTIIKTIMNNSSLLNSKEVFALTPSDASDPLSSTTSDKEIPLSTSVSTSDKGLKRRILTDTQKVKSKYLLKRYSKPHKNKRPKKEVKPLRISPVVREILDFWEDNGLPLPDPSTKRMREAVTKIKGLTTGVLFDKKFTVDDIKLSIVRHQMMAFDDSYEPSIPSSKKYLQKLPLDIFIENSYSTNGNKSTFLNCFKNEPKPSKKLIEDKNPEDTKMLKDIFSHEICSGERPKSYSTYEENCFRSAMDKLRSFCNRNGRYLAIRSKLDAVEALCRCVKDTCGDGTVTITPGFLCSDTTFNYRFPQYLEKQGMMFT